MPHVVIALGGNAIAPAGTAGTAEEQTSNIARSMLQVAALVDEDVEVVLTHGNGPQVGNVLVKNELSRHVVPPVPLDWCVAQTQATIGFTIASTLSHALAALGRDTPVAPVVSRVLVDLDDPAWDAPSKPIGQHLTDEDEVRRREAQGQAFMHDEGRGWRRVVPSPDPLRSIDRPSIELLLGDGTIVVANGGGGIPVVDPGDGPLRGVEAVIDKDLAGAMLARELDADAYLILTDVPGVALDWGTDDERWLGTVTVEELRGHQADGHFRAGSMDPKVEAVCRFVEQTGRSATIAALDAALSAWRGESGTRVVPS